jgi:peroxiredoxin
MRPLNKRSHVLRLFLIVCLGCLAAGPVGEEKAKPVVDPKAAELLDKMTAAYRKLKALEVAGEVSINFDLGERKNQKTYAFNGSFAAPNLFHHESKAGSQYGSTGEKVYAYLSESNSYYATTEALKPERFVDLFKPAATMLFISNPSILMAASEEPMAALKGLSVKRLDDAMIKGKPYPALLVSGHAAADELTFVVDPETHLLRRAIFDSRKQFTFDDRPAPKSAETIIDYTTTKIDGEPKREQFTWSPPEGAVDAIKAARAPRENAAAKLQGKPAPAFTLKNLNDESVTLADLKGDVVVLDFWATWCGPCVASLPALDEFAKKHAAAGVKVFAVNVEEEKDRVAAFAKDRKLSLTMLLDTDGKIGQAYKAVAIPQTVVIGKDGNVRKVFVGANEKALEREVEAAMKVE